MPKPLPEFVVHCCELLHSVGPISARAMMGGWMLKSGDAPIGVIAFDALYLKVNAETKPQFVRAGGRAFTYEREGKSAIEMSYVTVPEDAMESPAEMSHWARLALRAGRETAAKKKPRKNTAKKSAPQV